MAIKNAAIRILYFTIVDIGRVDNGGGLVCRNHAARIAETSRVALTICNVGPPTQRAASEAFARQIGADFRFLELDPSAPQPEIGSAFIFEREAAAQTRVHAEAAKVIDDIRPDIGCCRLPVQCPVRTLHIQSSRPAAHNHHVEQ
jgi:hypothetical protein